MKFLTSASARKRPFDCAHWEAVVANASRDSSTARGFQHDVYSAPFAGDFAAAAEALLRYEVFAAGRMVAHVCTPDGRVRVGATVVQRVVLGLVALETAVRVIEVEQTDTRAHFAYATLDGHPERGVASFTVERTAGAHMLTLEAWSKSGHWLTVVGRPVSRALQQALTREAVNSFVQRAGSRA